MSFEWDPQKAQTNARKHGVEFADAVAALEDESAITVQDDEAADEERFVTLVEMHSTECSWWFIRGVATTFG